MEKKKQRFGALSVVASEWKWVARGQQIAEFALLDPRGQILREYRLIQYPDGRRWVGLPQRPGNPAKNEPDYVDMKAFVDKEAYNDFLREALDAVDRYLKEVGYGVENM